MSEFLSYIRSPFYNEKFKKFEPSDFFSLIALYFFVMIPIGIMLFVLSKLLGIEPKILNLPFQDKILFGMFCAPLIEETLFRLILVFNKKNLIFLITTIAAMSIVFIINGRIIMATLFPILLICLSICYLNLSQSKIVLIKNFKIVFYMAAITFAFLHIFNFNGISIRNFVFVLFLVIPQLLTGFILGYLRITYGFIYAVLFHFTVNLTLLLQL